MNVSKILFIIIGLLSISGCAHRNSVSVSQPDDDEYAIYSMIIEPHYPVQLPQKYRRTLTYVRDSTIFPEDWTSFESYSSKYHFGAPKLGVPRPLPDNLPKAMVGSSEWSGDVDAPSVFTHLEELFPSYDWKSIRSYFDSVNAHDYSLDSNRFAGSIPARLVTKAQYLDIFDKDTSPYGRPQWVQFSRVGFDRARNIAIVYFDWGQPGGGGKEYLVLKRDGSKWINLRTIIQGYT